MKFFSVVDCDRMTMPQEIEMTQRSQPARHDAPRAGDGLRRALGEAVISPAALAAFESLGRPLRLPAGATLLQAGETPVRGLWLLSGGVACAGKLDARERWWASRELSGGDWIDVASAWRRAAVALETVRAQTPVLAHEFPADEVLRLCQHEPGLLRALLRAQADQLADAKQDRQTLLNRDTGARLAGWLLDQRAASGEARDELMLRQTKKRIASRLGIAPETLSRTLKALQDQGLLMVDRYLVRFIDLAGLRRLAGSAT